MKQSICTLLVWVVLASILIGCNLEKEVEIEIPEYDRELVAECFLEVGKPFRLLLSESIGFFEGTDTPFIAGAEVVISHNGIHDTLPEGVYVDPLGFKLFNFSSSNVVPADYSTEYELSIKYPDGRHITGKCKVMRPISQKPAISATFNADSMASITVRWPDFAGENSYYRLALFKGKLYEPNPDNGGALEFDFSLDDRIGDGETFTIATLFDYERGDTLIAAVYHINYEYWRYLQSLDDAQSSSGNPFAQPGVIHSTVEGGIGVFTGFHPTIDTFIVP
jgi:hypothetical protein